MESVGFSFSDTIAGYVTGFDAAKGQYTVKTSDGRPFTIKLKGNTYAMMTRNLDEPYIDCTGQIRDMLTGGKAEE